LRITVDEQYTAFFRHETRSQVNARGCFSHAALLVSDRYDSSHCPSAEDRSGLTL
jgi:hypothetical protein